MNKFLLFIALLMTNIVTAQKTAVIVNSPSNIAGEKAFGTAAFGADISTGSWTGDCALAEPALGCNALTNGAALAGKFVVIDRGSCNFDVKCLHAQDAGAKAVVVLNHAAGGDVPFRMGSVDVGGQVTIPCVMLGFSDGVALKAAMNSGTVNMTIGSFPKEANDLQITKTICDGTFSQPLVFHPKYAAFPSSQVKALGDMVFQTGGLTTNTGTANQSNVKYNCTIKSGNSDVYNKTSDAFNIDADSTVASFISDAFDYNGLTQGRYDLRYTTNGDNVEKFNSDNSYSTYFNVTSNILSKARFNMATRAPMTSGAYLFGGGAAYRELMMPFRLKYGVGQHIDSIYSTVSTGTGGTVSGLYLEGRIYRWDDVNVDGDISSDEMILVALGTLTFDASDTRGSASFVMPLENLDGPEKVYTIKNDNELYFASIQYAGGSTNVFNGYDNDYNARPYFELKEALGELDFDDYPFLQSQTQDANGGPDMSAAGLFYFDCNGSGANEDETIYSPASIAIFISSAPVGTKDISDEAGINVELTPNPAIDYLRANIQLNEITSVSYNIIDMGGKVIYNAKESNTSDKFNPVFNVSQMSPGQYYLQVNTPKGFVKKGFVVVR